MRHGVAELQGVFFVSPAATVRDAPDLLLSVLCTCGTPRAGMALAVFGRSDQVADAQGQLLGPGHRVRTEICNPPRSCERLDSWIKST